MRGLEIVFAFRAERILTMAARRATDASPHTVATPTYAVIGPKWQGIAVIGY